MEKEIVPVNPVDDDTEILKTLDTIPKRLHYFAKKYPDRELFVFCSKKGRDAYTAGRLLDLAGRFAGQLVEQGLKCGEYVANSLPNSPERLITDLGATMAGCAVFNTPLLYADGSDVYQMARRSACKGIILNPTDKSAAWRLFKPFIADQSGEYSRVSCDQLPNLTTAVLVRPRYSERPFIETLTEPANKTPIPIPEPKKDDVAVIFHTSGTTGLPKLIPKTHCDVLERGAKSFPVGDNFTSNRSVIYFCDRILGWVGGYPLTTYAFGDTRVLLDSMTQESLFEPDELYNIIVRERCNCSNAAPAVHTSVSRYITEADVGNKTLFRTLITGGFPVRKYQAEMALKLADNVISLYGMSETFFLAQYVHSKDSGEFSDCICGKPLEKVDVEVRIEDHDGTICEPGAVGNILVRGQTMFSGYLNREESPDPDTTKFLRPDGWINVGDYGYLSKDGNLFVMGRTKECIITDGMKFYPSMLEAKLLNYPGVTEAVVVPVSDPDKYQVICACLKVENGLSLNTDNISKFCEGLYPKGSLVMHFPLPKFYMILNEDNFPLTVTGKSDRAKIRTMAEELYGETKHSSQNGS